MQDNNKIIHYLGLVFTVLGTCQNEDCRLDTKLGVRWKIVVELIFSIL